jgi:predicted RNA binding protein YcfA (HicA-like mRNA interferase family)
MKFREVRRMLKDDGWVVVVQEGSHQQWKHPFKPGRVTIAGQDGKDVKPGTLASIFKQAGWTR